MKIGESSATGAGLRIDGPMLPTGFDLLYLGAFTETPIEIAPNEARGEVRLQKLGGTFSLGFRDTDGAYAIRKLARFRSWDAQGETKEFDTDREIILTEPKVVDTEALLKIQSFAQAAGNSDGRATTLILDRTQGTGSLQITLWRNPERSGQPYFDQVYPFALSAGG